MTDRPRDAHRFGLFRWLASQQRKYGVTATFLLGDITENKDRHSSTLVNRVVDGLTELKPPIYWLRGNHDGLRPDNPFFRFLDYVDGVRFIREYCYDPGLNAGFIPHCTSEADFAASCQLVPPACSLFLHQTFAGAIAETGSRLTGYSTAPIEKLKPLACYAGDVHKPQKIGPVTYIGAPYHCRMGDQYEPRVLLLKGGKEIDLHFPAPRKHVLHIYGPGDIHDQAMIYEPGDHAKIIVCLEPEHCVSWASIKQETLRVAKEVGLEVHGLEMKIPGGRRERMRLVGAEKRSNADVLAAFCEAEGVADNVEQVGKELLRG